MSAAAVLVLAACGAAGPTVLDGPTGPAEPSASAGPAILGTPADELPAAEVTLTRPDGVEVALVVRVAATAQDRARGLMGVADLPAGTGMLFAFPTLASHGGFWMRGTLIPLDIAFVAAGEVVAVAAMAPCEADPCPITHPGRPYDAALEVPDGWLSAVGVGPGSRLRVEPAVPAE